MDKNKKLEKNSIFGNVSSYFVIFAGTFKYTVFPPFFYYKLLQDEPELVKKHGSIFIEYQSFLVEKVKKLFSRKNLENFVGTFFLINSVIFLSLIRARSVSICDE